MAEARLYIPKTLCDACYTIEGGEEKCCSHGAHAATCVRCGRKRSDDERFACTGYVPNPEAALHKGADSK